MVKQSKQLQLNLNSGLNDSQTPIQTPDIDGKNTRLQKTKHGKYDAIHFQEQRLWKQIRYKRTMLEELAQETSLVEQLKQLNPHPNNSSLTNYQVVECTYNFLMITILYNLAKTSKQKQQIIALY